MSAAPKQRATQGQLLVLALTLCGLQLASGNELKPNFNQLRLNAVTSTIAPQVVGLNAQVPVRTVAGSTQAPITIAPVRHLGYNNIIEPTIKLADVKPAAAPPSVHHTTLAPIVPHQAAVTAIPISIKPIKEVKAPAAAAGTSGGAAAAAAAAATASVSETPAQKLVQYFEPVCANLERLQPRQLFKVQSQIKLFSEKTAGKMSYCFMDSFSLDPNLTPISKLQLGTICSSRKLEPANKSSFKSFQSCAEKNWDKNLDQELERIKTLRLNCLKNHDHSKNDSSPSLSDENDDDISLINQVVGKVLAGDQKDTIDKSSIKVIDVGSASSLKAASANASVKASDNIAKGQAPNKKIMNDPNTVLVFVDEPATTLAPILGKKPLPGTTLAPGVAAQKHNAVASTAVAAAADVATNNNHTLKVLSTVSNNNNNNSIHSVATSAAPVVFVTLVTPTVSPAHETLKVQVTTAHPLPALPIANASTHAPQVKSVDVSRVNSTAAPSVAAAKVETLHKKMETTVVPSVAPTAAKAAAAAAVTTTTTKPIIVLALSAAPTVKAAAVAAAPSTTFAPAAKEVKLVDAHVASTGKPTTLAPKSNATVTKVSTLAPNTTLVPAKSVAPAAKTSKAPVIVLVETSTDKPAKSLEEVLKRQEKEKQELEVKMKAERESIMKQLQKKQDETDAKNAIKSLQQQRNGHGASDARLHQIEHERQMAIDPVGHTLKHEKYEKSKQQKLASSTAAPAATGAAAAAAGAGKKQ